MEAARQTASAFQSQVAQVAGQSAPAPAPPPAPATSEPKPAVNRPSTLRPWVTVYDWNKKEIAGQAADNNGQNLEFSVKAESGKDYYVVTGGRYRSTGDFGLTVASEN